MKFARAWLVATAILTSGCVTPSAPAYHLAGSIPLPDGGWDYASVDPTLNRLYLARTDGVTMIDLGTRKVTGKFAPAARGHEVLPLSDGTVLLVTNGASASAQFVDARTGATLATVKTGDGPDAAILDPASGLIMVMNHVGGSVTLVDPAQCGGDIRGGVTDHVAPSSKGQRVSHGDWVSSGPFTSIALQPAALTAAHGSSDTPLCQREGS